MRKGFRFSREFYKSILLVLTLAVGALMVFGADCAKSESDDDDHEDDECDNKDEVSDTATITNTNTTFSLSTPDARKDCHAIMTLCYEWADEDYRIDNAFEPSLSITFGTNGGLWYFPTPDAEVEEKEDDSGNTYYRWCREVDQGARNQPDEYVSYYIGVMAGIQPPADGSKDVSLWARIKYVPYNP